MHSGSERVYYIVIEFVIYWMVKVLIINNPKHLNNTRCVTVCCWIWRVFHPCLRSFSSLTSVMSSNCCDINSCLNNYAQNNLKIYVVGDSFSQVCIFIYFRDYSLFLLFVKTTSHFSIIQVNLKLSLMFEGSKFPPF